jgi:hypothetical protein
VKQSNPVWRAKLGTARAGSMQHASRTAAMVRHGGLANNLMTTVSQDDDVVKIGCSAIGSAPVRAA